MSTKLPVAILAATGPVGQRFVQLLDRHPMFEVVALTGSARREGKKYGEACDWILDRPMPAWAAEMAIRPSEPDVLGTRLVFSALPKSYAIDIEPAFARAGVAVCTNAGAFRPDPFVPVLLPEANPEHANLIPVQQEKHGWKGFIVCNPNCTSTGISIVLKILDGAFGVSKVLATSLQAVSGAGYPGVPSLDVIDNILPYIAGEEEKVEWEPRKILGRAGAQGVAVHPMQMSVHANRVPVSDGHTVCLSVGFDAPVGPEAVVEALSAFRPPEESAGLPSSPDPALWLADRPDRPQPRLDRMNAGGMATTVGRVRKDSVLDSKMVVLSHNTIRGAAGGSVFNAEFLLRNGFLG